MHWRDLGQLLCIKVTSRVCSEHLLQSLECELRFSAPRTASVTDTQLNVNATVILGMCEGLWAVSEGQHRTKSIGEEAQSH